MLHVNAVQFFFFRGDDSEGSDLSVLIDQKTYLEEVNRNLK